MSEYADIKSRIFGRLLKKLTRTSDIVLTSGRHTNVKCIRTGETYPIPTSHRVINKHIVKDFRDWLVRNKVCSKKEFDKLIK